MNATRSYLSLILFALALILAGLVMIVVVSIPVVGKGCGATPKNPTGFACSTQGGRHDIRSCN